MKLSQIISGSALAAIALINLAQAPGAIARTVAVTRGPNGAAFIVKADKVPTDAKVLSYSKSSPDTPSAQRQAIGGIKQKALAPIQRGPNGAFFPQ